MTLRNLSELDPTLCDGLTDTSKNLVRITYLIIPHTSRMSKMYVTGRDRVSTQAKKSVLFQHSFIQKTAILGVPKFFIYYF
jgi:hypothetical protein